MSAPDHRPYLVEGDLRTPEDVAAWLRQQAEDEPRTTAWCLHERLEDRLEEERREALERGAAHFDQMTERLECDDTGQRCAIAQADAFRAAARQP